MRPPIAPAISVSPTRLLGAAILLAVVLLVYLALAVRRLRIGRPARVDEPLARLRGFHIFGPDEEDEPPLHVPVIRARPVAAVPVRRPAAAVAAAAAAEPAAPAARTRPAAPPRPPVTWLPERGAPASGATAATASAVLTAPRRVGVAARQEPHTEPPGRRDPEQHEQERRLTAAAQRLPQRPRPPAGPSPLQADADLTRGRGILLVEDDATIASMYEMLLQTRGYTTRHAQDGVEGIAMVREERPALILLDMRMPRMDGLQFLEALRGWPKTSDIPVVVLSNVGDQHLVEKAMALGAVEYLVKAQTRPQVLIGALPHWLRGNRALTTLA